MLLILATPAEDMKELLLPYPDADDADVALTVDAFASLVALLLRTVVFFKELAFLGRPDDADGAFSYLLLAGSESEL